MGFYSPATLVKDAKRHGVQTRHVCAMRSNWECVIEADGAVRLGFCIVKGLNHSRGARIVAERQRAPFSSLQDFIARTALNKDELRTLAEIGALNALADHRRDALWKVEKAAPENDLFTHVAESASPLATMNPGERLQADYNGMNLTTGPHPMALLRGQLPGVSRACDLPEKVNGEFIQIAGNVICRQRPGTAKGFVFISLEDETGISNAIVTPALFEKMRLLITHEHFLLIEGTVQNLEETIHIKAARILPLPGRGLAHAGSHDFH
jgi:error-prone DNA polymerase